LTAKMRIPTWDDNATRIAIHDETGPLYIASLAGTRLDEVATKTYHAAPQDIARLGFAVARELNPQLPSVPDLRDEALNLAKEIAAALKGAKLPLIISGTSLRNEAIMQAAANVAWSLCESGKAAGLCYTVPECDSMGLGLLGGKSLDEAFKAVADGKADTVIVLENDLYRRTDEKSVDEFLGTTRSIIALDHLVNPTSSRAHITLPASTFAESDGTLVNSEGRAQRFYQVFIPNHDVQESWKWIRDILATSGHGKAKGWRNFDEIMKDMAAALPVFQPVPDIAPPADFRVAGDKIPRQPHRYSGRTAMLANISVHEPKPADDPDTPFSFSMEGYEGQPPAPLTTRYWSPGWNSVSALNKFQQEVGGPLRGGDPGKRLVEPKKDGAPAYFTEVPLKSTSGEQVAPHYDIFTSEELSAQSPAIIERANSRKKRS
jgi:NADH-quinone oxidoreductase subunit G